MYFRPISILSLAALAAAAPTCDRTLNSTVGLYTVQPNDTMTSISHTVSRGICDIARLNRMADAMLPLLTGEELLIPPETCTPDNSTCLILPNPTNTYSDCVAGGPHAYYTLEGDTIRYIALKLNITVEALSATAQGGVTDPDTPVQVDNFLKVPQCSPSRCTVEPLLFTYGTYKDLAEKSGTTVGQIMALNPTYNHTDAARGEGAVITLPGKCETLGGNGTVIS
ncbi:uncharacterized protein BO80DRAFT_489211 [Aspergillus ibericus CBS 121593]|uniref:LysM domain-containing protein n=1 Tax=Aspergillus ibericus CBS 121593 TaxID=1448316 RepID=A0A395GHR3_9EURO|nr:hypothetical protein BO80DRAFT_489211 [Aspergillus ibericus CBS 121593]RAK94854.1 hypothetical protein BO80DRAFT_489211 [Aspergillus ibericus CBS 121593]